MQKMPLLTIVFVTNFSFFLHGMEKSTKQTECPLYECAGVQYKKNNFGDIFPQWQNIPHEQLHTQLSSFVNTLKDTIKETPFIIEVPHEKAAILDAIKKAGFSFYHGDNDKSEWIFKNNSSIPDPYTSHIGGGVIIRKGDDVLVIEEKTRRGELCTPGGTTERQELVRTAAARELKEEVGLFVDSNDLILVAIVNRIKANKFNANNSTYYYIVDHNKVSGDFILNPNEVAQAFYAPLKDIAKQMPINGLNVPPATAAIAQHLLNKNTQSRHETVLDYRQALKKECDKNLNDIMTIEFIAQ